MKNSKIGFRESVSLLVRGYQIINGFGEHMLLSMVAKSVVAAICPFINIYLSALILNELTGARNLSKLIWLACIAVFGNLLCKLIQNILNCWCQGKKGMLDLSCQYALKQKLRTMDYIDTQDPEIQMQFDTAYQNQRGMGYGLYHLTFSGIDRAAVALTQILASIVLTVGLFVSSATREGFEWLNAWWMNVVMVCAILAPIVISALSSGKCAAMLAASSENNNEGNILGDFFFDAFMQNATQRDVRLYRQDKLAKLVFRFDVFEKLNRKLGLLEGGAAAFNGLMSGSVYLFSACKALGGAFGIGSVVQYVSSATQFISGVNELIGILNNLRGNMPYLKKFMDLLDIPNKKYMGSLSVEQRDDNEYEIEFHNVSFRYPGSENWALRNLNLKFNIGEKMAVVGENGSGKSTMVSLLTRLYEPTEGNITLNGIDIKKYDYDQYMAIFGVVFQDFALFPFTLGENVAASIHYDEARVTECLQKAGFGGKLAAWKKGLNTYLYKNFSEEGVVVSGGEAQKIALARALYKDAPFIVLDEPTAALDPVSEFEIYSKFNDIVEDKTAIYISHRLSSCRFCQDIVVFDQGRLVQRGSHEELLASDGKYAQLWNAQAQYYQE